MEQIAARGALGGDLAMTEGCFSMNNPRSRGGGTLVMRSATCTPQDLPSISYGPAR